MISPIERSEADDQLTGQDYLGVEKVYYEPKDIGSEKALRAFLEEARGKRQSRGISGQ